MTASMPALLFCCSNLLIPWSRTVGPDADVLKLLLTALWKILVLGQVEGKSLPVMARAVEGAFSGTTPLLCLCLADIGSSVVLLSSWRFGVRSSMCLLSRRVGCAARTGNTLNKIMRALQRSCPGLVEGKVERVHFLDVLAVASRQAKHKWLYVHLAWGLTRLIEAAAIES